MFTGIIEETGRLISFHRADSQYRISIACSHLLNKTVIGDSIAVNGVCLTVVTMNHTVFEADVSLETWQRSNLKFLKTNDPVNLERAMAITARLGGHLVQGHVDGTATISSISHHGSEILLCCDVPPELHAFLVEKGSIALNGISLTIARLEPEKMTCAIIPHTWLNTNLHFLSSGDSLNIEIDILAKYVFRYLAHMLDKSDSSPLSNKEIDRNFLAEHGFM
ncbi:riboflavin synthase [bacterium]|nr:riboflavin synthase [bacterium]